VIKAHQYSALKMSIRSTGDF